MLIEILLRPSERFPKVMFTGRIGNRGQIVKSGRSLSGRGTSRRGTSSPGALTVPWEDRLTGGISTGIFSTSSSHENVPREWIKSVQWCDRQVKMNVPMALDSAVLVALMSDPSPINVTFGSGEWTWARISLQFEDIIARHFQKAVELRMVAKFDNIRYSWEWACSRAGFEVLIHCSLRSHRWNKWSDTVLAGWMVLPSEGDILQDVLGDSMTRNFFTVEGKRR